MTKPLNIFDKIRTFLGCQMLSFLTVGAFGDQSKDMNLDLGTFLIGCAVAFALIMEWS